MLVEVRFKRVEIRPGKKKPWITIVQSIFHEHKDESEERPDKNLSRNLDQGLVVREVITEERLQKLGIVGGSLS